MRRLNTFVWMAILLGLILCAGCYTVLRHPVAESVTQRGAYYKSCADCHADAAYYHPYYNYGVSHLRWRDYYGYPWWYDDYWWWDGHDEPGDPRDVERGERHLWSPGGWASGGWGFIKGGDTPPPARPPEDAKDDSKDDENDDSKETDDRHLWKKPKKGF